MAVFDRDVRPVPRHAIQQADPTMPVGPMMRITNLFYGVADRLQGFNIIGVLA